MQIHDFVNGMVGIGKISLPNLVIKIVHFLARECQVNANTVAKTVPTDFLYGLGLVP